MDMDNRVGNDWEQGWEGRGEQQGKIGATVIEQQLFLKTHKNPGSQGEWTGVHMWNDDFPVLVRGGSRCH